MYMVRLEALRQAIADLERLTVENPVRDQFRDRRAPRQATAVLARLYATYAQAELEAHGIKIDLPQLCGDRIGAKEQTRFDATGTE